MVAEEIVVLLSLIKPLPGSLSVVVVEYLNKAESQPLGCMSLSIRVNPVPAVS